MKIKCKYFASSARDVVQFLASSARVVVQFLLFSVAVVTLLSVPDEDLTIPKWLCTLVLSKIIGVICVLFWFASLHNKNICDEE